MSTIAAGVTSGTALVNTGDTTGQLVFQTNGTTTAVTIGTNQVVTLAQPLPVASGGTGTTSTTFVNLATNVTGTLPIANGGTGATTLAGANIPAVNATNTFTSAQTFRAANAIRSEAASTQDAIVIAGRAGGTSSRAITLTPADLSGSRILTLPDPGSDETLGYLNIPQNVQTGSYTLVLTDAGKHIYRASGSAATWTIPAASSVAYPIGTALTFINLSATSVSIAITTDTMYLSSAGTTGTRTLAQYGSATAIKLSGVSSSGVWLISGSGLT